MGLLDDAIREHLELKRRHGADPSEVERQEQEALGPARRGAASPAGADAEFDSRAGTVGTLDDDEPESRYDDEFEDDYEDDYEDDLPAASVPAAEPEAPIAPPVRERPEDRFAVDRDEDVVEDRESFDPEPPPRGEPPAEPPAEDRADDEHDEAPAGEDVLEETPEFLQETPEHDRLWFEQKPPRDFEF